jgi:peptidoglycan/xylan/chitin deacetylase (PgdA/CDA1 family)
MRALALEYHDVVPGGAFDTSGFPGDAANSYKLDLTTFEQHLDVLTARAAVGVDVQTLDAGTGSAPNGALPLLFTFDDGGRSALDVAAPALEARGWIGHFFMTTSAVGTPGFLDAEGLRELARRGHVVGSHSHGHPTRMARLSDAELDAEWTTSRRVLEDALRREARVASVPGGYFSRRVAESAARAGFRWLFTSEPVTAAHVVNGCHVLGRYTLRRSSSAGTVRSLVSPFGSARSRQWLAWNVKKVAKTLAGDTYLRIRGAAFKG